MIPNSKLLAIVGPTASGKSELAVTLAKKFTGEIISCDSRQVYCGMDLGTGKVRGKWQPRPVALSRGRDLVQQKYFFYKGRIHHCIDFVNPTKQHSVAQC